MPLFFNIFMSNIMVKVVYCPTISAFGVVLLHVRL